MVYQPYLPVHHQTALSPRTLHGSSERSENSRDDSDQNEKGENDNDSDESVRQR